MILFNPPDTVIENFGRSPLVVTRECTCARIVRRESGAVTVFAVDPATPPQKSCLSPARARLGADAGLSVEGSSSPSTFGLIVENFWMFIAVE